MTDRLVALDLPANVGNHDRLARLPAAVWLSLIVATSASFRLVLATTSPAPSIFPDEIIYSELARSIGTSGQFLVRGAPFSAWTFGPLYALLISPAFRIPALPDAYLVAKAINSVVMSSAAVPTYLIARRLLDHRLSYLAACLSLLIPGMVFSSRLMTESLAYPVFLFSVLAMLRLVEQPTRGRQLAAFGAIGIACAVRAQAVVLIPALVTMLVVHSALELREEGSLAGRPLLASLMRYRVAGAALVATLFVVPIGAVLVGGTLGASAWHRFEYIVSRLGPLELPKWLLYHVAELDLAIGVLPLVAAVLFLRTAIERGAPASVRRFALVAGATTAWMILLASTFATQASVSRIQERYLFYVSPLILIAFLSWVAAGTPRRGRVLAGVAIAVAMLPLVIPYDAVLNNHLFGSTPGLVPWLYLRVLAGRVVTIAVVAALCVIAAVAATRSRERRRSVVPVAAYLVVATLFVWAGYDLNSNLALDAGVGSAADRTWIDDAVGSDAHVAVLWAAHNPPRSRFRRVWQSEFFNRSMGRVYYLGDPIPDGLPQTRVRLRGDAFIFQNGKPLHARYLLTDGPSLGGTVIAEESSVRLTLYEIDGVVRLRGAHALPSGS